METWVKISKVMPLYPHSILWEREGSLTAKSPSPIGQTKHNSGCTHFSIPHLLKLHVEIPNFFFDLNLQQITQISCNSLQNSSTLASILSDH